MVAALLLLTALALPAAPAALAPNPLKHLHHKMVLNALGEASLHAVGENATDDPTEDVRAQASPALPIALHADGENATEDDPTEDVRAAASPALPIAVVYRGPAACDGCGEAVAAALKGRYRVVYAGPRDMAVAKALGLAAAKVYIQPGGGDDMDVGWNAVKSFAGTLQKWVRDGGRYVGICMGGFLAGKAPGFHLLSSGEDIDYKEMPGADFTDMGDHLITVTWRQKRERIYFQGGPAFRFDRGAKVQVLATYSNRAIAAAIVPYGRGSVGVSGPHPEAPQSWLDDAGFDAPETTRLFVDLVDSTVKYGA